MRCFVSIPVPRERLAGAPATLQEHLTLRFLGELVESQLRTVGDAIGRAARRSAPFRIELRGLGVFPDRRRPRVLWVGIGSGGAELATLAGAIGEELAAAALPGDDRPFVPHVTVRRLRSGREAELALRDLEAEPNRRYGELPVDHVDLQESLLRPGGAVHRVIESAPLGEAGPGAR